MGLVYIIEDEPSLRDGLVEAIGRLPGVQAYGFELVQDAVDVLDSYPPDLILTELNLPQRCGLDMLGELHVRQLEVPVVLVSGYLEAYKEHIPERPNVTMFAKPFDLGVLLQHVEQILAPAPETPSMGFVEYLKLACLGSHTVEILAFAEGPDSGLVGRVVVLGGQLWSAQDSEGMGAEAFLRLACLPLGSVACNGLQCTALMRNIYAGWETLIARATELMAAPENQSWFAESSSQAPTSFHPPGAFEPPRPLNCAPDQSQGGWALQGSSAPMDTLEADAQPSLPDFLAAASAAEAVGARVDALQHLERAMAFYPGHPEVLLWILRLRQ